MCATSNSGNAPPVGPGQPVPWATNQLLHATDSLRLARLAVQAQPVSSDQEAEVAHLQRALDLLQQAQEQLQLAMVRQCAILARAGLLEPTPTEPS